ncbi:MAG: Rpn family recombination-promoting nuclease/putative transposase, partial [bacterium]|nr:Rpn family recombination-promoting nuclease/putative transposase [bacterium]
MGKQKHIRFDWAVKKLLRSKANFGILEGFLSELLKEDIQIQEILESEGNKETSDDKSNRVDLLVKDSNGQLIIVEIQNTRELDYFYKILYNTSKAITEHIKEGAPYREVKKVITVSVVYFDLGQGQDYVYYGGTFFKGIHKEDTLELSESQKELFHRKSVTDIYPEHYIIKVNGFDDNAKDSLDEWVYFLKNSEIKDEFKAKGLDEAREKLKEINLSDKDLA